jgi:hypothetical protein
LSAGLAVDGLRGGICEKIGVDVGAVDHRVDKRNPLLGERAEERIGRKDARDREAAIEIGGDGLRFEKLDIAVAHDGQLAERMNGEDLRRAQPP